MLKSHKIRSAYLVVNCVGLQTFWMPLVDACKWWLHSRTKLKFGLRTKRCLDYFNVLCTVIAAECESPVNFVESVPSYSDTDNDDLAFVPLPMKNSPLTICPSSLQRGDGNYSTLAAHGDSDTASCSSVYQPILVVPSSGSFVSLIRTPDSSPDRPPVFSPSQARWFHLFCNDSQWHFLCLFINIKIAKQK